MKKDLIFAPVLLALGAALFLLRATGMTAHIAVSIVGVLVLAAYTVLSRRDWRFPALEIAMRACYGDALVTGIIMMRVHGIISLAVLHRAGAVLFLALLVILLVAKAAYGKGRGNRS